MIQLTNHVSTLPQVLYLGLENQRTRIGPHPQNAHSEVRETDKDMNDYKTVR